jgi:hypothetical protein
MELLPDSHNAELGIRSFLFLKEALQGVAQRGGVAGIEMDCIYAEYEGVAAGNRGRQRCGRVVARARSTASAPGSLLTEKALIVCGTPSCSSPKSESLRPMTL